MSFTILIKVQVKIYNYPSAKLSMKLLRNLKLLTCIC